MNIAALFIRRPIMTTLVMTGILLFGVMAYLQLPVNDLPNVDFPVLQVSAALPGASPETMAASVATPLERQFSTIAGLDSMSSTSQLGGTAISLTFTLDRNIDAAAQDVQAAIAQAARQLPADMPTPPSYQKVNPADQPILYLALTSQTLPLSTLDEYGETMMAQRISMVSGVAQVLVFGSQKYAVRIQVDPAALSARDIGIDEVSAAIRNGNSNLPTGVLWGRHTAYTVQATGQLTHAEDYKPLIVAYRNGAPVRLGEIGKPFDSVENDKTFAWYCTQEKQERAIVLAIQRQPGTNTVEVARMVRDLLPTFRTQLPDSVQLAVLFDRSESIRNSVGDVQFTLLLTFGLVVMVIFLFLRNVSATIIPSLALPMSIIGTFSAMYFLGYSMDNLSLMALTLAVGFVVDDAIVMLENIVRHMEMGKSRMQAALDGSKEIAFTIVSMTLSLAAVFIPVLLMGGLVGRLFHEFAVTIGAAVLVSGFVSLTLTPMMSSRFVRPPHLVHHGHIYAASEWVFNVVRDFYAATLRWALRHKLTLVVITLGVMAGTVYLFGKMPMGFLPSEDRGQILAFTEGAQGISYQAMKEHQQAAAAVVQRNTDIDSFFSTCGARGGVTSGNSGIMFMRLKPRSQRQHSADEIIQELRPQLAKVTGIRVYLQNPPLINPTGRLSRSQYQFTLQSPNTDELYRYALEMEQKMRELPGFLDVNSDLQMKNPQVNLTIDRDKASSLGISATALEDILYDAYGSRQISTILAPTNQYQVILELQSQYQTEPSLLNLLYVRSTTTGKLVPLTSIASVSKDLGPLAVNHTGQLPSVTISFNLPPGSALGDAVKQIDLLSAKVLPATITTSFQGTAQAFQSSMKGMGLLLALAVLVIYMVLGILYESFIHPLTILSALPFAGLGALLTLYLFHVEISLYAFVGVIMLVGLVKKNGIMMVDFAIEARRVEGKSPRDAIYDACLIRFRPIMMTTLAALMAALPIAYGYGAGGESRRPLGLAVVGGLLFSQTLTLYVTPVIYVYLERLSEFLRRSPKTDSAVPLPLPEPVVAEQ